MPSEFELIRKYFTRPTKHTRLGVGDDCALVQANSGMELALSTDMLVSGTHFFPDADPFALGHKVLAVNLSDLAAMGAKPRWGMLAVATPAADEAWIEAFSRGFFSLADKYDVDLIGGDTTRGPLNFCMQIIGEVPIGAALMRSGAKVSDDIWVSGELGDAALALAHLQNRVKLPDSSLSICLPRLHIPTPRIELGLLLRGLAASCIDISDGLLADLGHILDRSSVGAELWLEALPRSAAIHACPEKTLAQNCVLAGGDDYELCFTAPAIHRAAIEALTKATGIRLSRIGKINPGRGLSVLDANHQPIEILAIGFDHFKQ
ncbi:MAG: thiamine-phosphate kinase [Pseudomonadota bacterium]